MPRLKRITFSLFVLFAIASAADAQSPTQMAAQWLEAAAKKTEAPKPVELPPARPDPKPEETNELPSPGSLAYTAGEPVGPPEVQEVKWGSQKGPATKEQKLALKEWNKQHERMFKQAIKENGPSRGEIARQIFGAFFLAGLSYWTPVYTYPVYYNYSFRFYYPTWTYYPRPLWFPSSNVYHHRTYVAPTSSHR